ncbi:MAG: hypothetical protein E6J52_10665 [Chloroflexi bacterium]|nr:MAG: hypothetical protein E6J52_10665 [Chloroflexota bacterium]
MDTTVPRAQAAVASARAALAEAQGDVSAATEVYADAATRWRAFGHRVELGHALFGHGRCSARLDRPNDANKALDEAREIFSAMKANALIAAVDRARARRDAFPRASAR